MPKIWLRNQNSEVYQTGRWRLIVVLLLVTEEHLRSSSAAERNRVKFDFLLVYVFPCPFGFKGCLKGRRESSVTFPITLPPMWIISGRRFPVFCDSGKTISLALQKNKNILKLLQNSNNWNMCGIPSSAPSQ